MVMARVSAHPALLTPHSNSLGSFLLILLIPSEAATNNILFYKGGISYGTILIGWGERGFLELGNN